MSRRKRATLTDLLNDLTYKVLYNKYKTLAVSRFEWEGLPDGIETKHIEKLLFSHGCAIFFKDPDMSYMCLEASSTGRLNVYGEPVKWRATGIQYSKEFSSDDCVIIDNNILRISTDDIIMFYVNKLTEIERTMDVNVKAVKTPTIFACDDKDVLTFKRIFQQVDGNVPAMFVDRGLNIDSIKAFKTEAKFMCNELMDYKKQVENELLTCLGINNVAVDKKERVSVPETESNNQLIDSFADLMLEARQKACEEINNKYKLSISVKLKEREVQTNVADNSIRHVEIDA